jgi:hypothetical protein
MTLALVFAAFGAAGILAVLVMSVVQAPMR